MRKILIVLVALACQQYAHAQSISMDQAQDDAVQASLDARDQFVTALENKDFASVTREGLDSAIHEFAEQIIADQRDPALAQELLGQWTVSYARFEEALAIHLASKALGDHAPLFPWLNDFINKAAAKYGAVILQLKIVKDIQILNFAIPVVFNPTGSWQSPTADNRIEYRKHFIPFANLVTYYVTLYGCKYELKKHGLDNLKQICSKAADKLEFVMGRYIAPVVSDWIFNASNHAIAIGEDRLRYKTANDLRQAIQE